MKKLIVILTVVFVIGLNTGNIGTGNASSDPIYPPHSMDPIYPPHSEELV